MGKSAHRIDRYAFQSTDGLFFDANIWLFIYGPRYGPQDRRTAVYSAALRRILAASSSIFMDVLVLSEFVNACARFAYNTLPRASKPPDFKSFRNTAAFRGVARNIANACGKILSHCVRTESGFTRLDTAALLTEYEKGQSDLNDQVLGELCVAGGLKLVTHDSDFGGQNLTILTANKRLLNRYGASP